MNSQTIEIRGANFCYAAYLGGGLIEQTGSLTRKMVRGNHAAIIADANIPGALLERVEASLARAQFKVKTIVIRPGENSKSLREVERICGEMSEFDRTSVIIGVGGGVVGDLSGFVAAIFHRGIPHVQIPTTLLAMVDSSIGGKTAVNLNTGKNLVGAIHHPALVIADTETLKTLPARELRQGYAEIVKHAIIRDAEMFAALRVSSRAKPVRLAQGELRGDEGSRGSYLKGSATGSLDFARDDELIARNIKIKARIVSIDDREVAGERALLNFGHTVGHAIEGASDFQISHGDCVSLGMVAACNVSVKRAKLPHEQRDEVTELLNDLQLPTRLQPDISREKIFDAVRRDKKFEGGKVRFVVTPKIGEAYLSCDVTMSDIGEAVEQL